MVDTKLLRLSHEIIMKCGWIPPDETSSLYRNALPELLDEVERLRERVKVLETAIEEAVINDPDAKYSRLLREALDEPK